MTFFLLEWVQRVPPFLYFLREDSYVVVDGCSGCGGIFHARDELTLLDDVIQERGVVWILLLGEISVKLEFSYFRKLGFNKRKLFNCLHIVVAVILAVAALLVAIVAIATIISLTFAIVSVRRWNLVIV